MAVLREVALVSICFDKFLLQNALQVPNLENARLGLPMLFAKPTDFLVAAV